MEQGGLLAERHGMLGRQHAHRRADTDSAGASEQQRRQRDGRRAYAVRYEMMFGQPDRVEPGLLRDLGGPDRPVQGFTLSLTRELGCQYECSYAHRLLPPYGRRGSPPYRQQRPTRAKGTGRREVVAIYR